MPDDFRVPDSDHVRQLRSTAAVLNAQADTLKQLGASLHASLTKLNEHRQRLRELGESARHVSADADQIEDAIASGDLARMQSLASQLQTQRSANDNAVDGRANSGNRTIEPNPL